MTTQVQILVDLLKDNIQDLKQATEVAKMLLQYVNSLKYKDYDHPEVCPPDLAEQLAGLADQCVKYLHD